MRTLNTVLLWIACCALAFLLPGKATAQEQSASPATQEPTIHLDSVKPAQPSAQVAVENLPDSPGAELAQSSNAASSTSAQFATQEAISQESQNQPQRPVGTAAAEAPKVSGITAAEPAGVAMAPAKQKRVRTLVLKVGAIIAAGAAVGTVIALSEATSSKPPGAH